MLISTSWIREFVDLPENLSAHDILNKITLSVAEVECAHSVGAHLKKIKVAEIVSLRKHPEADKLNLVTINFGAAENKEVVCGASNVRAGLKIPYAPLGTTLPGGLTLEAKKIRGILSEGMLCSAEELGLEDNSDGLYELPKSALIGQTLLDFFHESEDIILDIDNKSLTHRPDLWCHFGFAREFSAVFELPLKNPYNESWKTKLTQKFSGPSPIIPKVDSDSSCLAYLGLSLENVTVEASPIWMQTRLKAVGLRPINNIVDISNYVMLELGIPLHIFDRDLISGQKIEIRKASSQQSFVTLDDISREILESDTVICDDKGPLVLAGIMGGKSSGVREQTKNIFIEVANWKASEVRRTSTRLGLRTDSSMRYEKSLDSELCERTMLRALDLVLQLCPKAKVLGKIEKCLSQKFIPLILEISPQEINNKLGVDLNEENIHKIFSSLDFQVSKKGQLWEVTVPSYRSTKDIECSADLIEEIGRIIGFDHIPAKSPLSEILSTRLSWPKRLHRKIQDFLFLNGQCLEIMTYPLVGEKLLEKSRWPELNKSLQLLNFWSQDNERLRPSLIPSFLEKIALNQKNYSDFRLFEIGRTYSHDTQRFCLENNHLIFAIYSKEKNSFKDVLDIMDRLLSYLSVGADFISFDDKFKNPTLPACWPGLHPHEKLNIRVFGKMLGVINTLHPIVAREFKIKGNLTFAVLDLSGLESRELKDKIKYLPIPRFPSSTFDCSVVARADEPVEKILQVLKKIKIKELVDTKIASVYFLENEQKSVSLRLSFFDSEQTLSGEFLTKTENLVVQELKKAGYPLKSN